MSGDEMQTMTLVPGGDSAAIIRQVEIAARVHELQGYFAAWTLRREMQDRIWVNSILKAWGFPVSKKEMWQN